MRILLQRVLEATVDVDGQTVGEIGHGLLIFHCVEDGDTAENAAYLAGKIARMRIFPDDDGKTNLSVQDVGGAVLVISQFTLAADWKKGNRPGFSRAAGPALARTLYEGFCDQLAGQGLPVQTGQFAADMKVRLVNDGPFTIWMDSRD